MKKVLLISEDYVKTNSNISDNLWGKFLTPAIREAQEISLAKIIGKDMLADILSQVEKGTIADEKNKENKMLLDEYIRPYLLYQVLANVIPVIGTKLSNMGNMTTDDEKAYNISSAERDRLEKYYQSRADYYCGELQDYLCDNSSDYPEMNENNLHSSASTGLWLGGLRGRKLI